MENKDGSNLAEYLFHQGTNYEAYKYLGVHLDKEKRAYTFITWAPCADEVFLLGDFNMWQETKKMQRQTDEGLFCIQLDQDEFDIDSCYKYKIKRNGNEYYKADPYAFYAEEAPKTASKFYDLSSFSWQDGEWLNYRKNKFSDKSYSIPINIYEVHLGSWKKENGCVNYRTIAKELCSYVKKMGYTHIELMPVMEHPFDGSWGYQITGYYAPTSRYGTPDDFKYFVDFFHRAGVGVILDWVPAHFPKDAHGLYEFDGTETYEYRGNDRNESKSWGTRKFDVGRNEVQCFLVSNALFWLKEYHIDGLRIDAVSSMLYLDFDKEPGEWFPNPDGSNHCVQGVEFFKKLNGVLSEYVPDALVIAEESTAWNGVTKSVDEGGLGFTHKWNMGWMNDTLEYLKKDAVYRKYIHNKITFPIMYAFNERFILPISHDEVVHGKKSLLDKVTGDYWQKFACSRAYLAYMMTSPGKKLLFMGCEIGQFREWDYKGQIEWFLLDYDMHARFQSFVRCLNSAYLENKELWENDYSFDGFRWIDADNCNWSIFSYIRYDKEGNFVVIIVNFTPIPRHKYVIGVPENTKYTEILNSDEMKFGGTGIINYKELSSCKNECHNMPYSLTVDVGPYGAVILKPERKIKKELEEEKCTEKKSV